MRRLPHAPATLSPWMSSCRLQRHCVSLRLAGRSCGRAGIAWAGGLLCFAAAAGGDGMGRVARLGRSSFRVYYLAGALTLGAAARHRLAPARRAALGRGARVALHRARDRRRGGDAAARRRSRRPTCRAHRITSTSCRGCVAIAGSSARRARRGRRRGGDAAAPAARERVARRRRDRRRRRLGTDTDGGRGRRSLLRARGWPALHLSRAASRASRPRTRRHAVGELLVRISFSPRVNTFVRTSPK